MSLLYYPFQPPGFKKYNFRLAVDLKDQSGLYTKKKIEEWYKGAGHYPFVPCAFMNTKYKAFMMGISIFDLLVTDILHNVRTTTVGVPEQWHY